MNIAEVIGWKFNHQAGMSCRENKGVIEIVEFPNGIPSKADQDLWTSEYAFMLSKKDRRKLIKNAARKALRKLDKDLDTGDLKVMRWLWPAVDQSLVHPKLVKAMAIDTLMRVALKAVRQATTIAEVDAVAMPVWP